MKTTKKLERLLLKYKKANRARLNAYARRSRITHGKWDNKKQQPSPPGRQRLLIHGVTLTPELKKELNANIEKARLYKLEVSKELRAYCKKKKLHLQWGSDNSVTGILSHVQWYCKYHSRRGLLDTLYKLRLSK